MISLEKTTSKYGTFSEEEFNNLMNGHLNPRASALLTAIYLPKKGEQTVVIISLSDDGFYEVKATKM